MKHIKKVSTRTNSPQAAMGTGDLLMLIGTIMTGIGSVLMGISPFFGSKGSA